MPSPSGGRRNFMSGGFRSLMQDVSRTLDIEEPMAFLGFDRSYTKLMRSAMASQFEVLYGSYEKMRMKRIGTRMLDEINRYESIFSIWKPDTELQHVNANAAREPVPLSPELFWMVKLAQRVYRETGGMFDITTTPLTRCWGFFFRQGQMPSEESIAEAMENVGMQHVVLDEEHHTVFFQKEGIELTPASVGKGMAVDAAIRLARRYELNNVMMNGGYSSIYASGAPAWKDRWQFNIRNPLDFEDSIAQLSLRDRGFSSSGREEQNFEHNGKIYGHIINPLTGYPVENTISVNVVAKTAAEAEALSTAFYVMGVEKTLKYCENHQDVSILMVIISEKSNQPELVIANFDDETLEVWNESWETQRHIS